MRILLALVSIIAMLTVTGCSSAYYETLEKFGIEKRDLLIDRVEDARNAQGDASEQFADALDQFRATVSVGAADLEESYERLDSEYEDSKESAQAVSDRIDEVKRVSDDLFDEWDDELDDYADASLKKRSSAMLEETRARYETLIAAMEKAESSMFPVLEAFEDQVLILKHNLNSRAIGALKGELAVIERDTQSLIAEMQRSISEADAFLKSFRAGA